MNNIILIEKLSVVYKEGLKVPRIALEEVSFSVSSGEIFGFLGPNGAGKTTTIKVLLGLRKPDSGRAEIFTKACTDISSHFQLGYMPETAYYYQFLTPRELLFMYGKILRMDKNILKQRITDLLEMVGLSAEKNILMKNFSKGMMQKVSLAQALLNDPDLLILDEPTSGLDPLARMQVRDIILDLKKRGKTVFFSSHELSEVETISDRIVILNHGRVLKTGELNSVLNERGEHESLEKYFLRIIQEEKSV